MQAAFCLRKGAAKTMFHNRCGNRGRFGDHFDPLSFLQVIYFRFLLRRKSRFGVIPSELTFGVRAIW